MKLKKIDRITESGKKHWKIYIKYGAAVLILLIICEVIIVNRLSIHGDQLQKLQDQKEKLKLENILLREQIASEGSYNRIKQQALEFGFEDPMIIEYIK